MSVYKAVLPTPFPYVAIVTYDMAVEAIQALMDESRSDGLTASSFALTVDNSHGTYNLWLSKASHDFLCSCIFEGMWERHTYDNVMFKSLLLYGKGE